MYGFSVKYRNQLSMESLFWLLSSFRLCDEKSCWAVDCERTVHVSCIAIRHHISISEFIMSVAICAQHVDKPIYLILNWEYKLTGCEKPKLFPPTLELEAFIGITRVERTTIRYWIVIDYQFGNWLELIGTFTFSITYVWNRSTPASDWWWSLWRYEAAAF